VRRLSTLSPSDTTPTHLAVDDDGPLEAGTARRDEQGALLLGEEVVDDEYGRRGVDLRGGWGGVD
jgi:hypothetical protein